MHELSQRHCKADEFYNEFMKSCLLFFCWKCMCRFQVSFLLLCVSSLRWMRNHQRSLGCLGQRDGENEGRVLPISCLFV